MLGTWAWTGVVPNSHKLKPTEREIVVKSRKETHKAER